MHPFPAKLDQHLLQFVIKKNTMNNKFSLQSFQDVEKKLKL